MRLDKYLCDCGAGTRKEVKKLIRSGSVTVDGKSVNAPEYKVDENSANVCIEGRLLVYKKFVYLMLNKPPGYISATWDREKPVVTELVPEEYFHFEVFPVGRLDIDTVGLLVMTNDGDLAHKLTSPVHHIPKTYYAEVDGELTEEDVVAFSNSMDLGDFVTKPARLTIISTAEDKSCAEVVIAEGKFHQIKRMFEKVGKNVTYLKRVAMNKLALDESLGEGDVRELTIEELELLTCDSKK